jgi:plastocyanin
MKKFLVYLGMSLLLAGVLAVLASKQSEPSEQIVYSDEVIIHMTDDGFVPQEIHITRGTRVRFINESEVRRWPASDLHPTHTIYAAFDPKEPIAPGEEWSFVFEKTGEWSMHDHLAPYIVGILYVTDTSSSSF